MGAGLVGMARHGGVLPVGGTFFVFSDYLKPSRAPRRPEHGAKAIFVFTHDSVGVGEDGPTHQPIEQLAALRAIPGLQVIRPADANETAAAWRVAVEPRRPDRAVLTRQSIPVVHRRLAVEPGAAVVRDADGPPDSSSSAPAARWRCASTPPSALAAEGIATRVVSMPSWDRFERAARRRTSASVLPPGVPVLSVEAATTFGWARWADDSIGIDRFGASAPGAVALDKLGINVDNVVARATRPGRRRQPGGA